eukprot:TRINITY_DN7005_c0_g1_i1.p1 TRINITY_DN7005_c0_g1~~TRINITY_DN7005_c0_g1_i1.p1  ORF type:complete len:1928 (-),score=252.71 TRINITY_DN7005_c0_g1_i1:594-6377(-)
MSSLKEINNILSYFLLQYGSDQFISHTNDVSGEVENKLKLFLKESFSIRNLIQHDEEDFILFLSLYSRYMENVQSMGLFFVVDEVWGYIEDREREVVLLEGCLFGRRSFVSEICNDVFVDAKSEYLFGDELEVDVDFVLLDVFHSMSVQDFVSTLLLTGDISRFLKIYPCLHSFISKKLFLSLLYKVIRYLLVGNWFSLLYKFNFINAIVSVLRYEENEDLIMDCVNIVSYILRKKFDVINNQLIFYRVFVEISKAAVRVKGVRKELIEFLLGLISEDPSNTLELQESVIIILENLERVYHDFVISYFYSHDIKLYHPMIMKLLINSLRSVDLETLLKFQIYYDNTLDQSQNDCLIEYLNLIPFTNSKTKDKILEHFDNLMHTNKISCEKFEKVVIILTTFFSSSRKASDFKLSEIQFYVRINELILKILTENEFIHKEFCKQNMYSNMMPLLHNENYRPTILLIPCYLYVKIPSTTGLLTTIMDYTYKLNLFKNRGVILDIMGAFCYIFESSDNAASEFLNGRGISWFMECTNNLCTNIDGETRDILLAFLDILGSAGRKFYPEGNITQSYPLITDILLFFKENDMTLIEFNTLLNFFLTSWPPSCAFHTPLHLKNRFSTKNFSRQIREDIDYTTESESSLQECKHCRDNFNFKSSYIDIFFFLLEDASFKYYDSVVSVIDIIADNICEEEIKEYDIISKFLVHSQFLSSQSEHKKLFPLFRKLVNICFLHKDCRMYFNYIKDHPDLFIEELEILLKDDLPECPLHYLVIDKLSQCSFQVHQPKISTNGYAFSFWANFTGPMTSSLFSFKGPKLDIKLGMEQDNLIFSINRNKFVTFPTGLNFGYWMHIAITYNTLSKEFLLFFNGIPLHSSILNRHNLLHNCEIIKISATKKWYLANFSIFREYLTKTDIFKLYALGSDFCSLNPYPGLKGDILLNRASLKHYESGTGQEELLSILGDSSQFDFMKYIHVCSNVKKNSYAFYKGTSLSIQSIPIPESSQISKNTSNNTFFNTGILSNLENCLTGIEKEDSLKCFFSLVKTLMNTNLKINHYFNEFNIIRNLSKIIHEKHQLKLEFLEYYFDIIGQRFSTYRESYSTGIIKNVDVLRSLFEDFTLESEVRVTILNSVVHLISEETAFSSINLHILRETNFIYSVLRIIEQCNHSDEETIHRLLGQLFDPWKNEHLEIIFKYLFYCNESRWNSFYHQVLLRIILFYLKDDTGIIKTIPVEYFLYLLENLENNSTRYIIMEILYFYRKDMNTIIIGNILGTFPIDASITELMLSFSFRYNKDTTHDLSYFIDHKEELEVKDVLFLLVLLKAATNPRVDPLLLKDIFSFTDILKRPELLPKIIEFSGVYALMNLFVAKYPPENEEIIFNSIMDFLVAVTMTKSSIFYYINSVFCSLGLSRSKRVTLSYRYLLEASTSAFYREMQNLDEIIIFSFGVIIKRILNHVPTKNIGMLVGNEISLMVHLLDISEKIINNKKRKFSLFSKDALSQYLEDFFVLFISRTVISPPHLIVLLEYLSKSDLMIFTSRNNFRKVLEYYIFGSLMEKEGSNIVNLCNNVIEHFQEFRSSSSISRSLKIKFREERVNRLVEYDVLSQIKEKTTTNISNLKHILENSIIEIHTKINSFIYKESIEKNNISSLLLHSEIPETQIPNESSSFKFFVLAESHNCKNTTDSMFKFRNINEDIGMKYDLFDEGIQILSYPDMIYAITFKSIYWDNDTITCAEMSEYSDCMVVGCKSGSLYLWKTKQESTNLLFNLEYLKLLATRHIHDCEIIDISISKDIISSLSVDGTCIFWDSSLNIICTTKDPHLLCTSINFDTGHIALLSDEKIVIKDRKGDTLSEKEYENLTTILYLCEFPIIVTGNKTGGITFLNGNTLDLVKSVQVNHQEIKSLQWLPRQNALRVTHQNDKICILTTNTEL